MSDADTPIDPNELGQRALSRWDNEGGAIAALTKEMLGVVPNLSNSELVQLRVRVIALENMMIATLIEGSERQLQVARDMAAQIAPRPGFTQHPLTTQAAHHMNDLVDRAIHFRTVLPQ